MLLSLNIQAQEGISQSKTPFLRQVDEISYVIIHGHAGFGQSHEAPPNQRRI